MGYSVAESPLSRENVEEGVGRVMDSLQGLTVAEALVVLESCRQALEELVGKKA